MAGRCVHEGVGKGGEDKRVSWVKQMRKSLQAKSAVRQAAKAGDIVLRFNGFAGMNDEIVAHEWLRVESHPQRYKGDGSL